MINNIINKLLDFRILMIFDEAVIIIAYALILLGIWITFSESIIKTFKNKPDRFRGFKKKKKASKFEKHIRLLLYVVYNTNSVTKYYTFLIISTMLFVVSFILFFKRHTSMVFALSFSTFTAFLPYILLKLKLRNIRVEGSYEAEGLLTEILNQYKINFFNMIEAIDRAIPFLNDYPHSQNMLFRLSTRIKEYKTEEELTEIINEFIFSLNTQWAIMLGNNLHFSIYDKTVVTASLEDMLSDIRESKNDLELAKRLNNESLNIIKFLSPALYVLSIVAAVKFFGFTVTKFFDNQLNTDLGFKLFILIMVSVVINTIVVLYFKKQKFDF